RGVGHVRHAGQRERGRAVGRDVERLGVLVGERHAGGAVTGRALVRGDGAAAHHVGHPDGVAVVVLDRDLQVPGAAGEQLGRGGGGDGGEGHGRGGLGRTGARPAGGPGGEGDVGGEGDAGDDTSGEENLGD